MTHSKIARVSTMNKDTDQCAGAWVNDLGKWLHRPWWKVAINTVLRAVQPTRPGARPWLVVSICESDRAGERPRCLAFSFTRVEMTQP